MKATGIVRRIDELGRVVIPKEIRRTLRLRDGEPMEIFTGKDGEVVFKKYSPVGDVGEFSAQYAEAINKSSGIPVVICDKDSVIAVSGASKRDLLEKPISTSVSRLLEKRQCFASSGSLTDTPSITEDGEGRVSFLSPIVADGTVVGGVISVAGENGHVPGETEQKLISTGALFLSKQLEV